MAKWQTFGDHPGHAARDWLDLLRKLLSRECCTYKTIKALAFRRKSLNVFKLFLLRSAAARAETFGDHPGHAARDRLDLLCKVLPPLSSKEGTT